MNYSFVILIPTINRADLLIPALVKYISCYTGIHIFVYDNGKQGIYQKMNTYFHENNKHSFYTHVHIYETAENNKGVAGSWNALINIANEFFKPKEITHYLILNDDIQLLKTTYAILNIIDTYGGKSVIKCASKFNMCSFLLPKWVYETIGGFDEMFYPAYFEDNDYVYRLKLHGIQLVEDKQLNPELYRNSQTIAKDYSLNDGFENNKKYYINKWGGLPHHETFLKPFNL